MCFRKRQRRPEVGKLDCLQDTDHAVKAKNLFIYVDKKKETRIQTDNQWKKPDQITDTVQITDICENFVQFHIKHQMTLISI